VSCLRCILVLAVAAGLTNGYCNAAESPPPSPPSATRAPVQRTDVRSRVHLSWELADLQDENGEISRENRRERRAVWFAARSKEFGNYELEATADLIDGSAATATGPFASRTVQRLKAEGEILGWGLAVAGGDVFYREPQQTGLRDDRFVWVEARYLRAFTYATLAFSRHEEADVRDYEAYGLGLFIPLAALDYPIIVTGEWRRIDHEGFGLDGNLYDLRVVWTPSPHQVYLSWTRGQATQQTVVYDDASGLMFGDHWGATIGGGTRVGRVRFEGAAGFIHTDQTGTDPLVRAGIGWEF
jgi:hypothetical protein